MSILERPDQGPAPESFEKIGRLVEAIRRISEAETDAVTPAFVEQEVARRQGFGFSRLVAEAATAAVLAERIRLAHLYYESLINPPASQ